MNGRQSLSARAQMYLRERRRRIDRATTILNKPGQS